MMATALTLVRLRWSLTWAALRKSVWQSVGYAISLLMGVGLVIAVGAAAWIIGGSLPRAGCVPGVGCAESAAYDQAVPVMQTAVVLVGSFLAIVVVFIQLTLTGEGSTMNPHRFELYGIPDVKLQSGLLLAGLSGIPAVAGTASMMLWAMAYRHIGAAMVAVGVLASPLLVVTMMSLSKMVISLSTTLVTTKRGKSAFYIIITLLLVCAFQLPNIITNSMDAGHVSVRDLSGLVRVMAWTPLGAAFQLPFDAMGRAWAVMALRVLMLAATCVLCFLISTWCLRHERLTTGKGEKSIQMKGVGAFAWAPDSPSGAVSARVFSYLRRDPRQALALAMPLVFVVIFALQAGRSHWMLWQALIWSGLFMNMVESNGLAYDGRGFTMQAMTGLSGRADRRGRIRVFGWIMTVYMSVLSVAIFLITGDWRTTSGLLIGLCFIGAGFAAGLSSLGLAEVLSTVLLYPVASLDKPFSSPQGRAIAQAFIPFVYFFGSVLLILPTGLTALALSLTHAWAWAWTIAPVGVANGVAMLSLGAWIGGKLMDARLLAIVHTLEGFSSLRA